MSEIKGVETNAYHKAGGGCVFCSPKSAQAFIMACVCAPLGVDVGIWACVHMSVHVCMCLRVFGKVLGICGVWGALGVLAAMSVWLCACVRVCVWLFAEKRK